MAEERNSDGTLLAGIQKDLVSARFLLLKRLLMKSARSDFEDSEPRNQMERRILFMLYRNESSRVSELAFSLGNDVAQVSRGLAALRKAGLAHCARQRDPYTLTPAGRELGAALDAIALRREARLLEGLSGSAMIELAGLLIHLQSRALTILVDELALSRGEASVPGASGPVVPEVATRIHPLVFNIANSTMRSATASFKRQVGVSQFEWRILVNMADRPALSFNRLVEHVGADKAQVSRTLNGLVEAGLVVRNRDKAGPPLRLDLTQEGRRVYAIIQADALRRNALLVAGLNDAQIRRLVAYLDTLIANAAAFAEGEVS